MRLKVGKLFDMPKRTVLVRFIYKRDGSALLGLKTPELA
jgi:hypothetical protein